MGDRTVRFRPFPGREYDITGSDDDTGVLLSIESRGGRYGEEVAGVLASSLPPDGVVIDMGANIGVLSVLLADLVPSGRVIAFEPGPENLRYLSANAAHRSNVEVVDCALAASDGTMRFATNPDYPAGAHLDPQGELEVTCRSFDSWAEERGLTRVDAIKVDVEGAEPSVLAGAARSIARFHPLLVVECNVGSLRRVSGAGFVELWRQLADLVPFVGIAGPRGRVVPIRSAEHLELALGHSGVVDLVGSWRRPGVRSVLSSSRDLRRLRHSLRQAHPPDPYNFVICGPIGLRVASPHPLQGPAGGVLKLEVEVTNGSRWWLSSDFEYVPVNLGARWIEGAECARGAFAAPVAPGGCARVSLDARLPDEPGRHRMQITLVQEQFAWVVDLDPSCAIESDVLVLESTG